MKSNDNLLFRNLFIFAIAVLGGLFFSAYILQTSGSITWIVLMFSLLLGVLSIWVPAIIVAAFVIATIVIPNEILPILSGTSELHGFGMIKLHPAGITLFVGCFLHIMLRKDILFEKIRDSRALSAIVILFSLFTLSIFAQTLPQGGFKGIPQCLENYVFPFSFFLYLLTLDPKAILKILRYFVFLIVLLALYGLFEYLYGLNVLYDGLYSRLTHAWYGRMLTGSYRITTTIGHPLKNALYFLFAVPVSIFVYKKPLNIVASAVLMLAIFVTGSRIAFALGIIAILFCLSSIRFNIYQYYKNILVATGVLAMGYFVLYYSVLGRTLLRRFYEGQDSALIRMYSLQNAPALIKDNFFLGNGMSLSFQSSASILGTEGIGFENPWIMLLTDVGFITMIAYLAIALLTLATRLTCVAQKGINRGIYVALVAVLLMMSSFNSFGSRNTVNFLLWFNMALVYTLAPGGKRL